MKLPDWISARPLILTKENFQELWDKAFAEEPTDEQRRGYEKYRAAIMATLEKLSKK